MSIITRETENLIVEYEVRKMELLESIRTGVTILWSTQIGFLPWDLSWHSVLMKCLFAGLGGIAIYWASLRRWYKKKETT